MGLQQDAPRRISGSSWGLIALLLCYGNGCAWRDNRRGGPIPTRFNWAHMAILAATLFWSRADHISLDDLGVRRSGTVNSAIVGCAVGGVGLLITRAWLSLGFVQRRFGLPDFEELHGAHLWRTLCVQFLLGSAVFEEIAFRGVLQAQLARLLGPSPARLAGSAVFALWHAQVVWNNLRRLHAPWIALPLAHTAVLGALFAVGLILATIRDRTGNLAGGIVTHWLMLAGMVLAMPRRGAHSGE